MTVYVDKYLPWMIQGKPKWTDGGHLFGTDLAELHLFANSIGLKIEWFQGKDFPHYDLTASKRRLAIRNGATIVDPGDIPEGVIRRMPKLQVSDIDHDALDLIRKQHLEWRSQNITMSERYVPGEGDKPIALIIGEAPGAQEDLKRRPFVGDSGLVLRELMTIAGLFTGFTPHFGEANCWLTNVIKFRPPRNRTPYWIEVAAVRHLLRAEWVAVGMPRFVVPVGGVALSAVYGRQKSILKFAGTMSHERSRDGKEMFVFPMLHPSYVMRTQSEKLKEQCESHWEKLGNFLKGNAVVYKHA